MYDRVKEWAAFSEQVARHVDQYTLPQYGSQEGTEQIDEFTVEDCWKNVERYMNRRHVAVRGNTERLRDVIKVAHYMSFIYGKLKEELGESDVYEAQETALPVGNTANPYKRG